MRRQSKWNSLRNVSHIERRINEAERLGFERCIIPKNEKQKNNGAAETVWWTRYIRLWSFFFDRFCDGLKGTLTAGIQGERVGKTLIFDVFKIVMPELKRDGIFFLL